MAFVSLDFTSNKVFVDAFNVSGKKITLIDKFSIEYPEDAMTNGVLSRFSSLPMDIQRKLKERNIKAKNAYIIVNSAACKCESISLRDIPNIKGQKKLNMRNMVMQELKRRKEWKQNYFYDYKILGKDSEKAGNIKAQIISAPKEIVNNTCEIVKRAGLIPCKLTIASYIMEVFAKSIQIPMGPPSILTYVASDGICCYFAGKGITSRFDTEYVRDESSLINENFVLQDDDDDDDDEEKKKEKEEVKSSIYSNMPKIKEVIIDKILEYNRGVMANTGHPISRVLFYGEGSEEVLGEIAQFVIDESANIDYEAIGTIDIQDLNNVSYKDECENLMYNGLISVQEALYNSMDAMNLLTDYKKSNKISQKDKKMITIGVGVFVIALVMVMGWYGKLMKDYIDIKAKIDECQTYISDPANTSKYDSMKGMNDKYLAYLDYNNKCGGYIDSLQLRQKFNSKIINSIRQIANGKINFDDYVFNDTELNLKCYCNSKDDPAKFTKMISNQGDFLNVSYTGFEATKGSEKGDYSFTLVIELWNKQREVNVNE